jgi:hypothetical protein
MAGRKASARQIGAMYPFCDIFLTFKFMQRDGLWDCVGVEDLTRYPALECLCRRESWLTLGHFLLDIFTASPDDLSPTRES